MGKVAIKRDESLETTGGRRQGRLALRAKLLGGRSPMVIPNHKANATIEKMNEWLICLKALKLRAIYGPSPIKLLPIS